MSRHQANRRRNYGRRQHEIHERDVPTMDWQAPTESPPVERFQAERAHAEEMRPLPLGDLLGHHRWRWIAGRG